MRRAKRVPTLLTIPLGLCLIGADPAPAQEAEPAATADAKGSQEGSESEAAEEGPGAEEDQAAEERGTRITVIEGTRITVIEGELTVNDDPFLALP